MVAVVSKNGIPGCPTKVLSFNLGDSKVVQGLHDIRISDVALRLTSSGRDNLQRAFGHTLFGPGQILGYMGGVANVVTKAAALPAVRRSG